MLSIHEILNVFEIVPQISVRFFLLRVIALAAVKVLSIHEFFYIFEVIAKRSAVKAILLTIFDIIQIGKRDDFASRAFDIFIVAVILVNIGVLFFKCCF